MSDFVAKVERRRRAPEAIAHRVALHLSSKEKRALVCEASEDVFFYSTLYRKIPHSHTPEVFDADGRDGVVKVLGLLKDFGKSGRAYGIVDRDFNFEDPSHLCDGMCFVLDAYSFENLLVESACLQQFGKAFFGIDGSSSHFQMWLSSLDNFLSGVSKILHLEHAIAIWCRQNSKKCNLNNVNIRSYIDVENDGTVVERSGNFEKFVLDTNVELPDGVEDAIAANRSLIASMPLHSWFRAHPGSSASC